MKKLSKLSIKEKAKRYDEILARVEGANLPYYKEEIMSKVKEFVDYLLPELKESEDKRIRKAIYNCVEWFGFDSRFFRYASQKDCLAWLKKQGNQDNNEDSNILQRFSFYSYKDEPNILYLSGLYVNDECRNKGIGTKILEVADEVAKSLNCYAIRLKTKKDSNAERLYRTHGYNSLTTEDSDEIWLEKQGDNIQNPITFNNDHIINSALNDYCCKQYSALHKENGGVLSFARLQHLAMDIYGWCKKQYEQKPTGKVEPKFKVGNWYQCTKDFFGKGVTFDKNIAYYCAKEGCLQNEYGCHIAIVKDLYDNFKLWNLADAKDGDVLVSFGNQPFIYNGKFDETYVGAYCGLAVNNDFMECTNECRWTYNQNIRPAIKEQRDILKKAMTNKGYTFDFKKKELKITDWSKHIKYKNPSIIEKMIAEWSEEDEKILEDIKFNFEYNKEKMTDALIAQYNRFFDKIKSLKSQLKQRWSEEDEKMFEKCINIASGYYYLQEDRNDVKDWLKSIKLRSNGN